MPRTIRVALIGDYDPNVIAHRAIPRALTLAGEAAGVHVDGCWLATDCITSSPSPLLSSFDAFWCVPASPYRSTAGALRAIRYAREHGQPFLGTCGGFQHALLELARSLAGYEGAGHAELDPDTTTPVIEPLACALVETKGSIRFTAGSRLARCYNAAEADEGYHCSYGLNPQYRPALEAAGVRFTAFSLEGDVRGFELDGMPFFVGTLFQPERAALRGDVSPPVVALLRAALHVA